MTLSQQLVAAIINTPVGYFQNDILGQRNPGPSAKGSIFAEAQDLHSLCDAAVHAEPYDAGASGMAICTYVKLPIPGTIGVVSLDTLAPDTELVLLDEKRTTGSEGGGVDAYLTVLKGTDEKVDFSVAIIGPGDTKDEAGNPIPVLWTIHPGHTVPRPATLNDASLIGKVVKPAEAKALGLTVAKLVIDS